ncbi:sushi, von Willebrand factor type A, EGF and pentraxin domain-containing protein 1-like [Haliotis rufescens]|uniref:sushi, von Willebrand factor type A, EGF and pentraxin domain-containing protein 1-like n=1 Tax=Haliotis rufescens TaxID=6454 RepID=UPI00201F9137|nr:sushi, von Willebrand factor type A, EGF and pentraxin domain-containing protein 1-like [Haliotis rufescens]
MARKFQNILLLVLHIAFCQISSGSGGLLAVSGTTDAIFFTSDVNTYQQCYNLCAAVTVCTAFNFHPNSGRCELSMFSNTPAASGVSLYTEFHKLSDQVPKELCRSRPCMEEQYCVTTQSGDSFICLNYKHAIKCNDPPTYAGMTVESVMYHTSGVTAVYGCGVGYEAAGGHEVSSCTNTMWIKPTLICRATDCGSPPVLPNMTGTASTSLYGAMATYTCLIGFTESGAGTSTCQANGAWSIPSLSCTVVDCGAPSSQTNMDVSAPSTEYGATATYICVTGYTGSGTSTCQADGSWSTSSVACTATDCGSPPVLPNMTGTASTSLYGAMATYTCLIGFTESGAGTSTCQANGAWSIPSLSCTVVDCGAPSSQTNMDVSAPSTEYGATATYICVTGYTGSGTSTCQADGSWSTSSVACTVVDCQTPVSTSVADPVNYNYSTYGSSAIFACQLGKTTSSGTATSTCQDNGAWSEPTLQCTDLQDLETDSSAGTSTSLVCEDRVSGPSLVADDALAPAPCQNTEIVTGCSSLLDNNEPYSDGQAIVVVDGKVVCNAVNSWQATGPVRGHARCCSMAGLKCEYLQMPYTDKADNAQTSRTCKDGYWPTGCIVSHWHGQFDGVFLTAGGCTAQNNGPDDGVFGTTICCSAPNLNCIWVESEVTGSGLGDTASVSCLSGYTMTGCMSFSPNAGNRGAYIENVSGVDSCVAVNGLARSGSDTPPKAVAACCNVGWTNV